MGKHSQKPVLEYHTHREAHRIVPAAQWILTYQGHPFQYSKHTASGTIKYERTLYLQYGSALRARDRLRQLFDTEEFDIRMIGDGDKYLYDPH